MQLRYLVFVLLLCWSSIAQPYYNNDAIQLENIQSLTFVRGRMTTGRRSSPVSQLNCLGGTASRRSDLHPSTVQCRNVGSDGFGTDINWKCEADLESSVRFGETTVNCEGFSHPDDPYILKGSCGLEYTLDYTEQGRQGAMYHDMNNHPHTSHHHTPSHNGLNWGNVILMVIIGCIVYGLWQQVARNRNVGGYDSNPPPYPGGGNILTTAVEFAWFNSYGNTHGNTYGHGYGGYDPASCNPTSGAYGTYNQPTWRPGFWSGLGTGGMLGYLFGRPRTYGGGTYVQPIQRPSYGGSFTPQNSSPRTATAYATTRRR